MQLFLLHQGQTSNAAIKEMKVWDTQMISGYIQQGLYLSSHLGITENEFPRGLDKGQMFH